MVLWDNRKTHPMPIDIPQSDLARSIQHNADESWPKSVKIQVRWDGPDGRPLIRTETISSDQFFGHGQYGAPLQGEAIVAMIERMRKAGPPVVIRRIRRE